MNTEEFTNEQQTVLNTVFESLDKGEFDPATIKQSITDVIEKTMQWGKANYDKKATQVKKYSDILSELGYDPETSTNPKEFATNIKQTQTELELTKTEKETLRERIARLETVERERTEESNKLKQENDKITLNSKLTEAIGTKLQASQYIIKDLITSGTVKMVDGSPMFVNGTELESFDIGITKVIEANKELLLNTQVAGVNSSRVNHSNAGSTLTMDRINKMTAQEIKENMAEIKKLAGVR